MKVISIKQPFATLIAEEFKKTFMDKNTYPYIYNHILKNYGNKYAFHMINVKKIDKRIAKGQLGIWNLENDN